MPLISEAITFAEKLVIRDGSRGQTHGTDAVKSLQDERLSYKSISQRKGAGFPV
jgi:hypothetical protein